LNAARAILCAPLPGRIPPTPGCRRIVVEFSHLGHSDVKTTMIYTHVLGLGASGIRSPLDVLDSPSDSPSPRDR
jgi:hypothetical protein